MTTAKNKEDRINWFWGLGLSLGEQLSGIHPPTADGVIFDGFKLLFLCLICQLLLC